jgi:hypothetical protein
VVYIVFVIYGIGTILPWNAVISCFDFFQHTMPDYNPLSVYPFAVNFMQIFAMCYVFMRNDYKMYNLRISLSFFIISAFMIGFPFLAELKNGAGFWSMFFALLPFGFF